MKMHRIKSSLLLVGLLLAPALPALAQGGATNAAPAVVATPSAPVAATPVPAEPVKAAPVAAASKPVETTIGTSRPDAGYGQPKTGVIGLQPQVTKLGEQAAWMHNDILNPMMFIISVIVLGLMLWIIIRYRRKVNPVASKTTHNTFIEVVWTLIPVLILVGIAIPSISLLAAQFKPAPKGAITLKATGNQWFWQHNYPDLGVEVTSNMLSDEENAKRGEPRLLGVDNRIVLPVDTPIRLLTTANDVIHAWAIPAFWIKLDAVPGRINETSFTVDRKGVYYGQCSELCGIKHGYMPIAVEVVSKEDFATWIRAKGGKMPGDEAAAAAAAPVAAPAPAVKKG
jgi:cytochrome c oxidase subunit II